MTPHRIPANLSLSTRRLRLTPLTMADLAPFHAITAEPAVLAAVDFLSAPFSPADAQRLIRLGMGARDRFLAIRDRRTGTLMGAIGAHLHGRGALEIGYWLGGAFHGRGLAAEAASALAKRMARAYPGRRIVAECRPANRASWRVLLRAGFRPAGVPGRRPGRRLLTLARRRPGR